MEGEGAVSRLEKIKRGSYKDIFKKKKKKKKKTEQESQKRIYWVNMQQKDESSSPLHASLFKGSMTLRFIFHNETRTINLIPLLWQFLVLQ